VPVAEQRKSPFVSSGNVTEQPRVPSQRTFAVALPRRFDGDIRLISILGMAAPK